MSLDDEMLDACEWLRTRPPAVQEAIRRFPPVCRVRARGLPAGRIGRVFGYRESSEGVLLHVVDEEAWLADDPDMHKACVLCWMADAEVVQYDGNKTPEYVDRVLAGEDIEALNPGQEGRIEGEMP